MVNILDVEKVYKNVDRFKQIEKVALVLIILLVMKTVFYERFNVLKDQLIKSDYVLYSIETAFVFLLVSAILITIVNLAVNFFKFFVDQRFKDKFNCDRNEASIYIKHYYNYLYGSKVMALRVFSWLWIVTGFFYLLNEKVLIGYYLIYVDVVSLNSIISSLVVGIIILLTLPFLAGSLHNLLKGLIYEYAYLKEEISNEPGMDKRDNGF